MIESIDKPKLQIPPEENEIQLHPTDSDRKSEHDEVTGKAVENKEAEAESRRPTKKRKARTAYFIFQDEKRAEIQEQNKGKSVGVIARAIGQLWANLSSEEKEQYQKKAAFEKEEASKAFVHNREELESAHFLSTHKEVDLRNALFDFTLPLAKVRKICRLDPEVRGVSKEAILILSKGAECFTSKLGKEALIVAQMQNRRKLLPEDVVDVCSTKETFAFLRDDIKDLLREIKQSVKMNAKVIENRPSDSHGSGTVGIKPLTAYFGKSVNK